MNLRLKAVSDKWNTLAHDGQVGDAGLRFLAGNVGYLLSQLDRANARYNELYSRFELSNEDWWHVKNQLVDTEAALDQARACNQRLVALATEMRAQIEDHERNWPESERTLGELLARAEQELQRPEQ